MTLTPLPGVQYMTGPTIASTPQGPQPATGAEPAATVTAPAMPVINFKKHPPVQVNQHGMHRLDTDSPWIDGPGGTRIYSPWHKPFHAPHKPKEKIIKFIKSIWNFVWPGLHSSTTKQLQSIYIKNNALNDRWRKIRR